MQCALRVPAACSCGPVWRLRTHPGQHGSGGAGYDITAQHYVGMQHRHQSGEVAATPGCAGTRRLLRIARLWFSSGTGIGVLDASVHNCSACRLSPGSDPQWDLFELYGEECRARRTPTAPPAATYTAPPTAPAPPHLISYLPDVRCRIHPLDPPPDLLYVRPVLVIATDSRSDLGKCGPPRWSAKFLD